VADTRVLGWVVAALALLLLVTAVLVGLAVRTPALEPVGIPSVASA